MLQAERGTDDKREGWRWLGRPQIEAIRCRASVAEMFCAQEKLSTVRVSSSNCCLACRRRRVGQKNAKLVVLWSNGKQTKPLVKFFALGMSAASRGKEDEAALSLGSTDCMPWETNSCKMSPSSLTRHRLRKAVKLCNQAAATSDCRGGRQVEAGSSAIFFKHGGQGADPWEAMIWGQPSEMIVGHGQPDWRRWRQGQDHTD